jgi:hypothetical protein
MFKIVDFSANPPAGEGEGDSTNLTLSLNKVEMERAHKQL